MAPIAKSQILEPSRTSGSQHLKERLPTSKTTIDQPVSQLKTQILKVIGKGCDGHTPCNFKVNEHNCVVRDDRVPNSMRKVKLEQSF